MNFIVIVVKVIQYNQERRSGECEINIVNNYLLSKGIAVRYLSSYGIENALRITLGTKPELQKSLEILREFKGKNE